MLKEKEIVIQKALIALDVLVISFVFFLAFLVRQNIPILCSENNFFFVREMPQPYLNINTYIAIYFISVFLWALMLSFNGMYRSIYIRSLSEGFWTILRSAFWVMIFFSVFVFLLKFKIISRLFFLIFMVFAIIFLTIEKIVISAIGSHFLQKGYNRTRLLIVGTGKRALHLIDVVTAHHEWGYDIIKTVDYTENPCKNDSDISCQILGTDQQLRDILNNNQIDEVIFIVPRQGLTLIERYIYVCEDEGIDVAIAADFFNIKMAHWHHTDIDGVPLITFEKRFEKEWQLFFKRSIDICVSGMGIILLSPLFFIIILFIKLTSPGPAFFLQQRVSLHGRKFTMYKFRSMNKDAEKELKKLRSLNEVEGPIFKIKNDPRVTPVGRVMRRFSLDELPQLFNVFIGRMSLAGPRPALPNEIEQYTPSERRRLSVRPGITCIWQAFHRDENNFEKWMHTDLDYVDNWSLKLDFKIIMATLKAIIMGKGAY